MNGGGVILRSMLRRMWWMVEEEEAPDGQQRGVEQRSSRIIVRNVKGEHNNAYCIAGGAARGC